MSILNRPDNFYSGATGFSPTFNSAPASRIRQQMDRSIIREFEDELMGDFGSRLIDKLKYLVPEDARDEFTDIANQPEAQQLIGNVGHSLLQGTGMMSALGGSDVQMGLGTFSAASTFRSNGAPAFGGGPNIANTDEAKAIGSEIKEAIEKEFAGPAGYLSGLSGLDRGEVGQMTMSLGRRGAFSGQSPDSLGGEEFKNGMGKTLEATSSLLSDMKDIFGEGKGINELLDIAEALTGQVLNSTQRVQQVQQSINEAVNSAKTLGVDARSVLETNVVMSQNAADRYSSTERVAAGAVMDNTTGSLIMAQSSQEAARNASRQGFYIQSSSFEKEQASAARTELMFNDPAYKLSRNAMTSLAQAGATRDEIEEISSREGFGTDIDATRNIIDDLESGKYSGVNLSETNLTKKEQDQLGNKFAPDVFNENKRKALQAKAGENIENRLQRGTLGVDSLNSENASAITDTLKQYRTETLVGAINAPGEGSDEVNQEIFDLMKKTGLRSEELSTVFNTVGNTEAGATLSRFSEQSQEEKLRVKEEGFSKAINEDGITTREDDSGVVRSFFEGVSGFSVDDAVLSKQDKYEAGNKIRVNLGEGAKGLDFSNVGNFGGNEYDLLKAQGAFEAVGSDISKEEFINDRSARANAIGKITEKFTQIRTKDETSGDDIKTLVERQKTQEARKLTSEANEIADIREAFGDDISAGGVVGDDPNKLILQDLQGVRDLGTGAERARKQALKATKRDLGNIKDQSLKSSNIEDLVDETYEDKDEFSELNERNQQNVIRKTFENKDNDALTRIEKAKEAALDSGSKKVQLNTLEMLAKKRDAIDEKLDEGDLGDKRETALEVKQQELNKAIQELNVATTNTRKLTGKLQLTGENGEALTDALIDAVESARE